MPYIGDPIKQVKKPNIEQEKTMTYYERLEQMSNSELVMECRKLDHELYAGDRAYEQLHDDYMFVMRTSREGLDLLHQVWLYAEQYPEHFTHDLYSKLSNRFNSKEPF